MDAVHAATQDCFGAIQQIRRTDPNLLPQPEVLQRRMRTFVDRMQSNLRDTGLNHSDVDDITYAVCALADEVALNAGEPLASGWMGTLLQFHYFRENTAGDGFFNRLDAIRKDPRRRDVLRVYALCLWFGFQGKYRVRGGELELMSLGETLQRDVGPRPSEIETLSPHADRPTEPLARARGSMTLLYVAGGALLLALLLFVALRLALASSTSGLSEEIALVKPAAGGRR
jgi:type VI secretion system protein ImpK